MATKEEVPPFNTLLEATVEALSRLGGSGSNAEIHDEVVELLDIPPEIVEVPHKADRTYLIYRLHWARSFLKKVGAVDNTERGVWTLTSVGRAMTPEDIAQVQRKVREIVRTARLEKELASNGRSDDADDGDVVDDAENWTDKMLDTLKAIPPDAFERLCQRVLRESGFIKVEVTGRSGDGGIDGHGVLRVNLVSFQVLFQSKRWKDSVGNGVVRDFRGAMVGRADKGLIITTGRFTADARAEATRDGAPAIDLVDGEDLCQLLKELRIGVRVKMVEEIEVDEAVLRAI